MSILNVSMYFITYSVLGWAMEIILCSLSKGKLIERGFLKGPYCPIYGIGCLLILTVTGQFVLNPFYVFILSMIVTSALEFFSGYALEELFGQRWWDYSDHKYNLMGHICLKNAIAFGVLSLLIVYIVHPYVLISLSYLSYYFKALLVSFAVLCMAIDFLTALKKIYVMKEQ